MSEHCQTLAGQPPSRRGQLPIGSAAPDAAAPLRSQPPRRKQAVGVEMWLTVLGLAASCATTVSFIFARWAQFTSSWTTETATVMPASYYVSHAAEIVLLTAAGIVSLAVNPARIERGYMTRFILLLGAALLMTARSYSLSDLLSTKLADSTGPFCAIVSVLVFVGARRRNWQVLGPAITITCALFCGLVLFGLAGLASTDRMEAVVGVGLQSYVVFWTGAWVALKEYKASSIGRYLRFVPIGIFALSSVFTQTRLNFVLIVVLLLEYAYVQHRRRLPQARTWLTILGLGIWICLFAAVFMSDTRVLNRLGNAADAFVSRLDEDSRSGQLVWFFDSVAPTELLLGRGSFATWTWGKVAWRGGTDVGYLTLLLYGGLPLLLTYVAAHILPALRALRRGETGPQLTAACVVVLWGVVMFSSAYPGPWLSYYPVLFCVGACISREDRNTTLTWLPAGGTSPRIGGRG